MLFAMVPMAQYALPFAAGFGATLAYHRMALDNELTACHAGGVSHRVVLIPAVLSGLAMGAILLVLSNSVIPRFLQSMEGLITQDATRLMVSRIDRGQAIEELEGLQIFADDAHALEPSADHAARGAYQQIWLGNVLVVQRDPETGEIIGEGFARQARLHLYPTTARRPLRHRPRRARRARDRSVGTRIEMRLIEVTARRAGEGAMQQATLDYELRIGDAFKDDPKYLTWTELQRLRDEPERMNFIDARRRVVATHLAQRQTLDHLRDRFAGPEHAAAFTDPLDDPVRVRAGQMRWVPERERHVLRPPPGEDEVVITTVDENGRTETFRAAEALLRAPPETEAGTSDVRIDLTVRDYRFFRDNEQIPGRREEWTISGLHLDAFRASDFLARSSFELLADADAHVAMRPTDDFIRNPANDLRRRIEDLNREILSKQHERLAMSAACFVMVLCGGVIALRLRDALSAPGLPLVLLPGTRRRPHHLHRQGMVHDHGYAGLPILWGGVALLGAFTVIQFLKLSRH